MSKHDPFTAEYETVITRLRRERDEATAKCAALQGQVEGLKDVHKQRAADWVTYTPGK